MGKSRFFTLVVSSWALVVLGTWVAFHTTPWLEIGVIAGAVLIYQRASSSRASSTQQIRTAAWGTSLYLIGFALLASGMTLKMVFQVSNPIPGIVAGAGIWAIGIAWMCAAALWNGSWFVGSDRSGR